MTSTFEFELPFEGRIDRNGHEYFVNTLHAPILIDVAQAVIMFRVWEEPGKDGAPDQFGGTLVVKRREPFRPRDPARARTPRTAPAAVVAPTPISPPTEPEPA